MLRFGCFVTFLNGFITKDVTMQRPREYWAALRFYPLLLYCYKKLYIYMDPLRFCNSA